MDDHALDAPTEVALRRVTEIAFIESGLDR
jgi:hypothetical protein